MEIKEYPELLKAMQLLETGEYTCVLYDGHRYLTTKQRGVKPLVQWLEQGNVPKCFAAADKVVGKATAFLYCLLGAKAVYANVMSRGAKAVLEVHGVHTQCTMLTDYIINRTKNGICPFEEAVLDITDPKRALTAIYKKMNELGIDVQ